MLALGSQLFNNTTYLSYARRVIESCIWAYTKAPNRVIPEVSTMRECSDASPAHDRDDCTFSPVAWPAQRFPGFESVIDSRYILRPEVIESVFYMYRITGETQYQDVAWDMFTNIEKLTRTEYANAAIVDGMMDLGAEVADHGETKLKLKKADSMENFWPAETPKYFYLVFSKPAVMSLDEWVFNTEAHGFRLGA